MSGGQGAKISFPPREILEKEEGRKMIDVFIKMIWPVEGERRVLKFRVGVNNTGTIIEEKVCNSKREVLKETDRLLSNLIQEEIKAFPNSFSVSRREELLA